MVLESGTVLKIETIDAVHSLAPAFLFATDNHFPVDVVALEDCEVIIISKDSIMKQFTRNKAFLLGYMALISDRVHFLSERLKLVSTKTIKGKLAKYILVRAKNMHFTFDLNQTELAEYFGVARP